MDRQRKTPQCDVCAKTFRTNQSLLNHRRNLHNDIIIYYECPQCRKQISYLKNFAPHYQTIHKKSLEEALTVQQQLKPFYKRKDLNGKFVMGR